jgi:hypothetical protein
VRPFLSPNSCIYSSSVCGWSKRRRCTMQPAQTCYGMYFNTDSLRFFVAFANVNTA